MSDELEGRITPDTPEGAELRIERAIGILNQMQGDVARLATTVENIASHPNVYRIVEEVDNLSPTLTAIQEMLGTLNLDVLFEDYDKVPESPTTHTSYGGDAVE